MLAEVQFAAIIAGVPGLWGVVGFTLMCTGIAGLIG